MKLLGIIVLLFVAKTCADYCLGAPSFLGKGASCPRGACKPGLYCDNTLTCAPLIEDGQPCFKNFGGCKTGSQCKGPEKSKICVKNAGPGESCNSNNDVTTPSCGSPLSCSNNKCIGGRYGDKCAANVDCVSAVCTGGVCSITSPVLNTTCSVSLSVDFCGKDYYCKDSLSFFSPGSCQPKVDTRFECLSDVECPFNHLCARKENKLDVLKYCTPIYSLNPGAFNDEKDKLCKSSIGAPGPYCADQFPEYCSSSCGDFGICYCGSSILMEGIGSCKQNGCLKEAESLNACALEKCLKTSVSVEYSTSCFSLNCLDLYNEAIKCVESKYGFTFNF